MNTLFKLSLVALSAVFVVALYFRFRLKSDGFRVTSWYRTPWKNAMEGGAKYSQHMIGWAFDVTPVNSVVYDRLRKMGFRTVLKESDHIHASVI